MRKSSTSPDTAISKAPRISPGIGDIRRIGPYGPIYEVIGIESPAAITIREPESERVTHGYLVEEFHNDLPE